jgi:amphi-Trp domain-containing protein
MVDAYEHELTASRDEIAAVLEGLADGIRAGIVQLGEGGDAVTVPVPDSADLEIEYETEEGETSLEVELEWDAAATDTVAESTPVDAADGDKVSPGDETEAETASEGAAVESADEGEADEAPGVADDLVAPVGAAAPIQSLARFEVFRDRGDEWRWRLRHRNGNVIATGGEGYTRKHNALKGLRSVMGNAPGTELVDED